MATQQIDYASFLPPSNNKGKKYHCVSHKRLIAKACVQVLEDTDSSPKDKLKAAAILERISKARELAAYRRNKIRKLAKKSHNEKGERLNLILGGVSQ